MRPRLQMIIWLVVAGGLLVAGGMTQQSLQRQSIEQELVPGGEEASDLLSVVPGAVRAFMVNYYWIRLENQKDEGRYYAAGQLANWICRLQPRFVGVWSFQAWNMAYNISVGTHTPRERWQWVFNGIRLLRDDAIPRNPRSILLYRELAWTFFHKMGGTSDSMHMVYKQRWASRMQMLLGAPTARTTADLIEAFRPITEAPLDKDIRIQGRNEIQAHDAAVLLADPQVAAYVAELTKRGIALHMSMLIGDKKGIIDVLEAYRRYSLDDTVEVVRQLPPNLKSQADKDRSEIINSPEHASARGKILAFLRAQLLWNHYRMDPDHMLAMMEEFGPLDWRTIWPHAMYWSTYGFKVCENLDFEDLDPLNIGRVQLNCLKDLTWFGRMTYVENPEDLENPDISLFTDWRFIERTETEFQRIIKAVMEDRNETYENNALRSGHVNYLIQAIQTLYAAYQRKEAQRIFTHLLEEYGYKSKWGDKLEDFVIGRINKDGRPLKSLALNQVVSSIQAAYVFLLYGETDAYRNCVKYAARVHHIYSTGPPIPLEHLALRPLMEYHTGVLSELLIRPRKLGYNVSLVDRSRLYRMLPVGAQTPIYDIIAPWLRRLCDLASPKLDLARAFPEPPGIEAYRSRIRREQKSALQL